MVKRGDKQLWHIHSEAEEFGEPSDVFFWKKEAPTDEEVAKFYAAEYNFDEDISLYLAKDAYRWLVYATNIKEKGDKS